MQSNETKCACQIEGEMSPQAGAECGGVEIFSSDYKLNLESELGTEPKN